MGAFIKPIQDNLVQAEYWADPMDWDEYIKYSVFLSDINQQKSFNQTYRDNLLSVTNFTMVKFTLDTVVIPKESEWFGYYEIGQQSTIVPLEQSPLWQNDTLGLKELYETNRLFRTTAPFEHMKFNASWFEENIVPILAL